MEQMFGFLIGVLIFVGINKGCAEFEKSHPIPTTQDRVKSCHDYCVDLGTKKFSFAPGTGCSCSCIFGDKK